MKYTTEEFDRYLNAFQEGNTVLMNNAVGLVTSNVLWSEICSEISNYRKQSLVRKVLRYVAETALRGTMEIDGLAYSQSFYAMKEGEAVSFGTPTEWSFWSDRLNKTIYVRISKEDEGNVVRFFDLEHNLLMKTSTWPGLHWYQSTGRIDLMLYFDDVRNKLIDNESIEFAESEREEYEKYDQEHL